ncbi:MAG: hypothetical protein ACLFP1_08710 [Candidatus Goldiibacteriota bacterium]
MAVERKVRAYSQYVKTAAVLVFAAVMFWTISRDPKVPEEIKENTIEAEFRTIGSPLADNAWNLIDSGDGYVIIGDTAGLGAGGTDMYVIKTDYSGNLLWTRTFGGPGDDTGVSVIRYGELFIAAGSRTSSAGDTDAYVVMFDENGDMLWDRMFGGADFDQIYCAAAVSDGSIVLAGYTSSFSSGASSNVYLLKIDPMGGIVWEKNYGGPGWDTAYGITETSSGNLALTGYTDSGPIGQTDMFLLLTDSEGNSISASYYGGERRDRGVSLIQTSDGGYLIQGKTTSFISKGMGWDMMLVKTDADGNSLWSRVLPASEAENGSSLIEADDGFFAAGTKKCYGFCRPDAYVVKVDADGNTVHWKSYSGGSSDFINSIIPSRDGNIIAAGTTLSGADKNGDIFIMKITPKGEMLW